MKQLLTKILTVIFLLLLFSTTLLNCSSQNLSGRYYADFNNIVFDFNENGLEISESNNLVLRAKFVGNRNNNLIFKITEIGEKKSYQNKFSVGNDIKLANVSKKDFGYSFDFSYVSYVKFTNEELDRFYENLNASNDGQKTNDYYETLQVNLNVKPWEIETPYHRLLKDYELVDFQNLKLKNLTNLNQELIMMVYPLEYSSEENDNFDLNEISNVFGNNSDVLGKIPSTLNEFALELFCLQRKGGKSVRLDRNLRLKAIEIISGEKEKPYEKNRLKSLELFISESSAVNLGRTIGKYDKKVDIELKDTSDGQIVFFEEEIPFKGLMFEFKDVYSGYENALPCKVLIYISDGQKEE